jgi:hypothetical protein
MDFARHPTDPGFAADGSVVSAVDWLGNRFQVGDMVMYCIGAGRGQMMAHGRVLAITSEQKTWLQHRVAEEGEEPTRVLDWRDPPVAIVEYRVPYDDIKVQVLTERTSGRWDNEKRMRPAWPNPMNITAIAGELLETGEEQS